MRRLGLLGLSTSAASALIASFASAPAAAAPPANVAKGGHRDGAVTTWSPVAPESITFGGPRTTLMAAWAAAAEPRGGVLVIHENRGLTEHIRTVAGRFAASGYSALALDLLSEEGGTAAFPGEAEVAAALAQIPPERFVADMKAAVTELDRRVEHKKLTAIGFCFGGGMVWRLLTSGEPRLAAAAPFYGPFPEGGQLEGSRGRARCLRRPRHARQRDSVRGQGGARERSAQTRDPHLRRGRPRLLQRHRRPLQRARRGRGLAQGPELVRRRLPRPPRPPWRRRRLVGR
jgi:dienelactone hydrolase